LTGFYCELVAYWRVEQIGIVMGRIFEQKWRLACSGGSLTDYVMLYLILLPNVLKLCHQLGG
jgi:hypothetical protein